MKKDTSNTKPLVNETKKKQSRPRRSGRGKREENKERTRRKILSAALALFSKKGFYRTTTKEISDKAKIAEGTVFNYFKTKEDIALYFFDEQLDALIAWYRGNAKLESAPLSEKLFAIVYQHLQNVSPYEDFIGAAFMQAFQPVSKLNPLSLETQQRNLKYLLFIKEVMEESGDGGGIIQQVGDLGAYGFGLYHFAILSYWLHDRSDGKERTLALLDRSLKVADSILKRGTWRW
jgi:AcrR family transcriptional regulator